MAKKRKQKSRSISAKPPGEIVNIAEGRSRRVPLHDKRKPTIFIAVPTVSRKIDFTIGMTFGRAMASSNMPECPFHFITHVEPGKRGVDYARNEIVKKFMEESDADWLVMIDEDQVVPDNFWQLCTVTDADVVSGVTPVWVANMDPEVMFRTNSYGVDAEHRCYNLPTPDRGLKQPYRVPIVGTGCIAVRRRVFAPKPAGVGSTPFYFTFEDNRKVRGGEDINFSVECNRAGFTLAVHPGVWFDHLKELPLMQLEDWYQARKKMEDEGRVPTEQQRLSIG